MVVPLPTTIQPNDEMTTTTMTTTMTASSERSATTAAGTGSVPGGDERPLRPHCAGGDYEPDLYSWEEHEDRWDEDEDAAVVAAYAENAENTIPYIPFMNLTKDERDKKGKQFKFGLCCECDAGLASENDFAYKSRGNGRVMMCHPCNEYYFNVAY